MEWIYTAEDHVRKAIAKLMISNKTLEQDVDEVKKRLEVAEEVIKKASEMCSGDDFVKVKMMAGAYFRKEKKL